MHHIDEFELSRQHREELIREIEQERLARRLRASRLRAKESRARFGALMPRRRNVLAPCGAPAETR